MSDNLAVKKGPRDMWISNISNVGRTINGPEHFMQKKNTGMMITLEELFNGIIIDLGQQKKDMDQLKRENKKLQAKVTTLEKEHEEMKQKMEKDLSDLRDQLGKSERRADELEKILTNVLSEHKDQIKGILKQHDEELKKKSRENKDLKTALDAITKAVNTEGKKVEWSWGWLLAAGVLGGLSGVGLYAIGTMIVGTSLIVPIAVVAGLIGAITLIMGYLIFR